eukprot:6178796-Pleurochrysis_carterae.AAC.1
MPKSATLSSRCFRLSLKAASFSPSALTACNQRSSRDVAKQRWAQVRLRLRCERREHLCLSPRLDRWFPTPRAA